MAETKWPLMPGYSLALYREILQTHGLREQNEAFQTPWLTSSWSPVDSVQLNTSHSEPQWRVKLECLCLHVEGNFSGNTSTTSCALYPWHSYLDLQKRFLSEAGSGGSKPSKANSNPIHSNQTGLQSGFWTSFSPWDLSTRNLSTKLHDTGKNVDGVSGSHAGAIFQISGQWESPLSSLPSRGPTPYLQFFCIFSYLGFNSLR